ncbi:DUF7315 family membrane protein [Halocatena pleomorpha]|uniref:DUF7315 domain-containing protein n=1 Tax=Halocatena pleomorpha TaxID=1785090 RepID=A0A3P3RHA9_9EURY|nr:hypothetical protein [Halocatena pleomorpha]RRJ32821.1 hypothetical protein EIK79_03960 [Halocatena pleomorpha]
MANTNGSEQSTEDGDVIVPLSVYKIVTVFSTLIAGAAVVAGFAVLDTATQQAQAPADEINVPLALLGIAAIVTGSAVYVFSTRFRTAGMGMGNAKDDGD